MISYLIGQPRVFDQQLTLLINGVGYHVIVGPNTLSQVQTQETAELFIYTHVREDQISLFGFLTHQEQSLFSLLLSVSGVGPKTAQSILDGRANQVVEAVQQANTSFFSAVPRVGKKLAQKIIIELRSKLGELKALDLGPISVQQQQVKDALLSLGFADQQIDEVLQQVSIDELPIQEAIKVTLKQLHTTKS